MTAGAAAFSVVLSLLSGRLLRFVPPRVFVPWALGSSAVLQMIEWWLLSVRPVVASVMIYLHVSALGVVLLFSVLVHAERRIRPPGSQGFGRIAAGGTIGGLAGGLIAETNRCVGRGIGSDAGSGFSPHSMRRLYSKSDAEIRRNSRPDRNLKTGTRSACCAP